MDFSFFIFFVIFTFVSSKPCEISSGNEEQILSLNKKLLRSVKEASEGPNPSLHLGLRLSQHHSLASEKDYLLKLKKELDGIIDRSQSKLQPITGLLALYTLALRASCEDLNSISVHGMTLLQHLKHQLHAEKEHIASSSRPLTNYYQYGLGVLALCVGGVRISSHVVHKLIQAQSNGGFMHKDILSIDTVAMAALAFQCLKESDEQYDGSQIEKALSATQQDILNSQSDTGLFGNVFSTPLAVQALQAVGSEGALCSSAMQVLTTEIGRGTFHNPMAMSQLLPILHYKTYLDVRSMECNGEDDSLILESRTSVVELSQESVTVRLVVEITDASPNIYKVIVPLGSSLLDVLKELHKQKPQEFSFETETSLWGPYLSVVNGLRARQADRTFWQLLQSPDSPLIEGISDYKIKNGDSITLRRTTW
ncbi:transcobalamin-2 [Amia ocellicauda]|uniref:transcobalamin-2 n=1 Tax=Amia ocellicauda TaxID=2972642 RepID=UPI0034643B67|nr:TCO2 protein [Amia calva]